MLCFQNMIQMPSNIMMKYAVIWRESNGQFLKLYAIFYTVYASSKTEPSVEKPGGANSSDDAAEVTTGVYKLPDKPQ